MSPSDTPEPASPSCLAHEADESYMGYASRAEIMAFLQEMGASAPTTAATREQSIHKIRQFLPKVRDDALYRELADLAKTLESGNKP